MLEKDKQIIELFKDKEIVETKGKYNLGYDTLRSKIGQEYPNQLALLQDLNLANDHNNRYNMPVSLSKEREFIKQIYKITTRKDKSIKIKDFAKEEEELKDYLYYKDKEDKYKETLKLLLLYYYQNFNRPIMQLSQGQLMILLGLISFNFEKDQENMNKTAYDLDIKVKLVEEIYRSARESGKLLIVKILDQLEKSNFIRYNQIWVGKFIKPDKILNVYKNKYGDLRENIQKSQVELNDCEKSARKLNQVQLQDYLTIVNEVMDEIISKIEKENNIEIEPKQKTLKTLYHYKYVEEYQKRLKERTLKDLNLYYAYRSYEIVFDPNKITDNFERDNFFKNQIDLEIEKEKERYQYQYIEDVLFNNRPMNQKAFGQQIYKNKETVMKKKKEEEEWSMQRYNKEINFYKKIFNKILQMDADKDDEQQKKTLDTIFSYNIFNYDLEYNITDYKDKYFKEYIKEDQEGKIEEAVNKVKEKGEDEYEDEEE